MEKTRIIAIFTIAGILTLLTIINAKTSISQTRKEFNAQEVNYTTETQTTLTTSKNVSTTTQTTSKTTKKTTKKTTQITKFNVIATQKEMLDYTLQEVLNMGWNSSEYEIVVKLVSHESGWNPNDVNKKSGACGLFQAHPCSKVFKQYPDYTTNYKSQIKWGLNYIKEKYKTPSEAWDFWLRQKPYHWY